MRIFAGYRFPRSHLRAVEWLAGENHGGCEANGHSRAGRHKSSVERMSKSICLRVVANKAKALVGDALVTLLEPIRAVVLTATVRSWLATASSARRWMPTCTLPARSTPGSVG